MESALAAQVDRMIIDALAHGLWRKTAFILASVAHAHEERHIVIASEEIFERVMSLCSSGLLESHGVLTEWRHSELRLKLAQDGEVS